METFGFAISPQVEEAAAAAERDCAPVFARIAEIAEYNSRKVLAAFVQNRVSATHFAGSTGYGYDDAGRENLDRVFAQALGCEDALVRHSFISGTHALSTALFGVLRPGDTLLSVTGKPYDTLDEVIGIAGTPGNGSLRDFGVAFRAVELTRESKIDVAAAVDAIDAATRVLYIQRSGGYGKRPALLCGEIAPVIAAAREKKPDVIVMVDNCYGEFTEKQEPSAAGADLLIGSLIKNAGGGLCDTGGYIAGRRDLVELCAYRLTSVGIGREAGCTLGQLKSMYEGLFLAPQTTAEALKSAAFASALLTRLGFSVFPAYDAPRGDIITAVETGSREKLLRFVQGIQAGSPVDSYVTPEPWAMPGYSDEVVMAAGAFTQGASIELSCDGPVRPPFTAYLQGGLTYYSAKTGIMLAASRMLEA